MSNQPNAIDILLRAKADLQAAQATVQAVRNVQSGLLGLTEQQKRAYREATLLDDALRHIDETMGKGAMKTRQNREEMDRLTESMRRARQVSSGEMPSGGGAEPVKMGWGVAFSQFLLGTGIRTLPGGRFGLLDEILMGASSLNSVVQTFKQLADQAGGAGNAVRLLLAELGPMTLAFGALTVALKIVEDQGIAAAKSMKDYFETLPKLTAQPFEPTLMGRTMTAQELQAQREEQELLLGQLRQRRELLFNLRREFVLQSAGAGVSALNMVLPGGEFQTRYNALNEQLAETDKTIGIVTQNLNKMDDAYVNAIAAANTYIENLQKETSYRLQLAQLTRQGTVGQIESGIEANQLQMEFTQRDQARILNRLFEGLEGAGGATLRAKMDKIWASLFERTPEGVLKLRGTAEDTYRAIMQFAEGLDMLPPDVLQLKNEFIRLNEVYKTLTQQTADLTDVALKEAWARKLSQDAIAGMAAASKEEVELQALIRTSSSDSARERLQQIRDQQTANTKMLDQLLKGLDTGILTADDAAKALANLQSEQQRLAREEHNLTAVALPLIEAREREAKTLKSIEQFERERAQRIEQLAHQRDELEQQMADTEQQRLKNLARQAEQDTIDATRAAIERNYRERIEAANRVSEERERGNQIAKLRREAAQADAKALREKEQADAKALREKEQADAKALREYNQRVERINREFMERELNDLAQFREQENKALREYAKDRARFLEDLYDELHELAAERDVAGFIQAEREGMKRLRRMDEDAAEETRIRSEQFAREREIAWNNREQELADLRASYEQERADRLADYEQARADRLADYEQARADRQADLEARIRQELEAGQQRLTQAQRLENELAALREQWAAEDKARRRRQEEQDYNERLGLMRAKHAEMLAELNAYLNAERQARQAVYSQGININYQYVPRHQYGLDYVPHDWYPAFLDEGEAVLTKAENEAYRSGLSGGAHITVNYYTSELATKADVQANSMLIANAIAENLRRRR